MDTTTDDLDGSRRMTMLRMTLFASFAAALVGVAISSSAQAWGCNHSPDYFRPTISPGYFSPANSPDYVNTARSPDYVNTARSPDYVNTAHSPDYFNPAHASAYGSSAAYGFSPGYSANYSGYSRR